jgi:hypothetical protein
MGGASDIYRNRGALGMPQPLDKHWWHVSLNSSADTMILEGDKTSPYENDARRMVCSIASWRKSSLFTFNLLSILPTPFTVVTALLRCYTNTGSAGRTVDVYRLLRTDWVSTQTTWNIYKTGSNWGTAGALNTSTDVTPVDAGISLSLATGAWQNWDVTKQVQTAFGAVSGVAHFLLRDEVASGGADITYESHDSAINIRPQLIVCGYA